MALDIHSVIDYLGSNQDIIDKLQNARLNRIYGEPERQESLNKLMIENKFRPETLESQNAFRTASAQNLMNPFRINQMLSSSGKHVLEPFLINALQSGRITQPQFNQLMQQSEDNKGQNNISDLTELNPDELRDYYAGIRQKSASDVATRNRVKFATNIEKTLANIGNPDFFDEYSGANGKARLKFDQAKAAIGKTSPMLKKYNNFIHVQVPILTSQIRQFYGDSIQPQVREELQQLQNPNYWYSNPELAKSQFDTLINLLRSESQTYNVALNAPTMTSEKALEQPLPPKSNFSSSNSSNNKYAKLLKEGKLSKKQYMSLPPETREAIKMYLGGS